MKKEDKEFMSEILDKSRWLFYGEFEVYLQTFLEEVFKHDLKDYGFEDIKMSNEFAVAYWSVLSELVSLDLAEYGTSPRGAWLTEKGERFKEIIMSNENAL